MISDRSVREYYKREHGIDLPENKNYGIDLSGTCRFDEIPDEEVDFILDDTNKRGLSEEEFWSRFEEKFGHNPFNS